MQVLAAALLLAQTWVSPLEQSYGPYLAPANGGEPAVVASADRVLLAWSELDPVTRRAAIRTGVLDFDGRLVSEIRTLLAWQAGAEATNPMAATDGGTFAVAWREAAAFPPSRSKGTEPRWRSRSRSAPSRRCCRCCGTAVPTKSRSAKEP